MKFRYATKIRAGIGAMLLVAFLAGSLHAQQSIRVQTTGKLSPDELVQGLTSQSAKGVHSDSVNTVLNVLLQRSVAAGFLLARIDSVAFTKADSAWGKLFVRVNEGPPSGAVRIAVLAADSVSGRRYREDLQNATSSSRIGHISTAWLDHLAEHGYPFAEIVFDSVAMDSSAAQVNFALTAQVRPGTRVTIDSIGLRGNSLTRRSVILRELPINPGMLFRQSLLQKSREKLLRLGYFRTVSEPELHVNADGGATVILAVEEGSANTFDGVVGYNPGTAEESGYFTGLLDLQFGNLLGTGREVLAKWEKRNRDSQELALRFREPWVLGYPLHLEGGFQQLIEDTLYVERSFQARAEWPFLADMAVVGTLARNNVIPDSANRAIIQRSDGLAAGVGLQYDSSDDRLNPRSGARFHTLIETVRKNATPLSLQDTTSRFRQRRVVVDASWFQPLFGRQLFAASMHWRQITSNEPEIPFADEFRLGGATTLRGYREQQFRGSRVAWANFEYRYLLSSASRAFLFYDLGYVFRNTGGEETEDVLGAFGLGVRVETPLGIVGVDYGLGEGDGLSQGKVHVRLTNRF